MLRDAGVRGKIFAVLAIPTLLLVVTSGWLVGGQVHAARQAGQVEAVTDVAIQLNRVVHSLQLERSVTLTYLQDPTAGAHSKVQGQRQYTNSQLRVLGAKIAASPLDSMSASIRAATARSAKAHRDLVGARASIDKGLFLATKTDVSYTKIIATDLQLPGAIAASASPALAQRLQAEETLSTTIEYASHERDLVELAYVDGTINETEFGQASALVAQQSQSLQDFARSAPTELNQALNVKLAASNSKQLDKSRRHLSDLLKGRDPDIGGSVDWLNAANPRISSMVTSEGQLVTDIANVAASLQYSEQLKAGIFGAAAFFGVLLAVLLAIALASRITLPLRRLTLAAGEIGEELPRMVERMQTPGEGPGVVVEPIVVESDDEIGRLAVAFNTVNEVTLRVAMEQAALRASIAEMFVNVARRNQVLLGRQLAQLDKMEAREEDPDLLKNLFRLDHLATRMRRNAESLLVLAGIDSTRRLRQAMPLSDVIRTAVGEIEAYERIDPAIADDPDVSGRHALSIAHLLAELLENATVFSNPGTRVVVATAMTGHGVDVTITDYGLGMTDEEIVQANESIAHPPLAEIAVSQRLGLFVVGRIAARLGATASLRQGRSAGTVVTVGLPLDVFEGLLVDEPVTVDHLAETTATTDAIAGESSLDEPIRYEPVTQEAVLVGAVAGPGLSDSPVAIQADVAMSAVPRFNPSEVALSRLPQIDVAALMADAEADSRSHGIAAPGSPGSSGRRLLPRRSRSDEPVEVATVDAVPVTDVPVGEVPVEGAPVDVVDHQSVSADVVPTAEAWAAEHNVVLVAEDTATELPDTELPDAELPDAELPDTGQREIASHARRRGLFFARRRHTPPAEPIETQELEESAVELAATLDDHDAPEVVEDQPVDAEPLVADMLFDVGEAVSDDVVAGQEAVVEAPVAETRSRRSLRGFARRRGVELTAEDTTDEPNAGHPAVDDLAVDDLAVDDLAVEESAAEPSELPLATTGFAQDEAVVESPAESDDVEQPVEVEAVEEPAVRRRLFGRRERVAAQPVAPVAEPRAESAVADVLFAPLAEVPVAFESVDAAAEEAPGDDPVADEPVEVVANPVPVRRSGLFGRRQRIADEPVAGEEAVAEAEAEAPDAEVLSAPVAEAPDAEVLSAPVAEAPDAEVLFAPVAEAVAAEPFTWPVAEEPAAVEQVEAAAEGPAGDDDVAEEPVEVVATEEPVRRGLFGRRQRSVADPVTAESVAESVELANAAEDLFAPAADAGVRESFAAHLPEPVAEPDPTPPAPLYFAPAIDILPGRPMGRRGKHGKAVPAPATPAAPAAPVTTYAMSPTTEPVAPPPPLARPDAFEPVTVEVLAVPPLAQPEHTPVAPSAPPRQASASPAEVSQPVASPAMSELDQLALNAELQKSALSELRGLYEPSFSQGAAPAAEAPAGLIRRQRRSVEAVAETETVPEAPSRSRDASEVRGMLTGFRAGVERGRSAPTIAADADADGGLRAPAGPAHADDEPTDDSTD